MCGEQGDSIPPPASQEMAGAEMVGTWDGPNPEPDTNYFRELNLESLAHILRCLESKEIGVVSIVCREFNTVLMGRNGAAGFTIQCVEKQTKKKWGDPALTALTELRLDSGWNQITDVTPLQHLTALTQLDLQSNQITAADPTVVELKSRGVTVSL